MLNANQAKQLAFDAVKDEITKIEFLVENAAKEGKLHVIYNNKLSEAAIRYLEGTDDYNICIEFIDTDYEPIYRISF
jgi:hypothetical protein